MLSYQLYPVFEAGDYRLYFNNDLKFSFTTKKDALLFASKVSRFMTHHWSSVNEIYTQSYAVFRRLYLVLDTEVVRLRDNFSVVEEILFRNILHNSGVNGAYFSFNGLVRCYSTLSECLSLMEAYAGKRKITSDLYQLKNLQRSVDLHSADIKAFDYKSISKAGKVIQMSVITDSKLRVVGLD